MNQNSLTGSFQNHLYIPCRVGITLIFGVDCDASVMEQVYVVDATKLSVRCIVGKVQKTFTHLSLSSQWLIPLGNFWNRV